MKIARQQVSVFRELLGNLVVHSFNTMHVKQI